jgi:hypothetical protein
MPGMMMKQKKSDTKPMSYKKGGMVGKPMHKMPDGKMMTGAKHGSSKAKK